MKDLKKMALNHSGKSQSERLEVLEKLHLFMLETQKEI
jgi:hypothetical protein